MKAFLAESDPIEGWDYTKRNSNLDLGIPTNAAYNQELIIDRKKNIKRAYKNQN